ncbi:MAG: OsmC family peroxiredoxin [Bacteroidales bacterium]
MSKHYAKSRWEGNLIKGEGSFTLQTSGYTGKVTFPSRFEDDKKNSSPEELIGAAHSTCFSMALAHALDQAGYQPQVIDTNAEVTLSKTGEGFAISEVLLKTKASVKDIEHDKFQQIARQAKENCPVSVALKGITINLQAELS